MSEQLPIKTFDGPEPPKTAGERVRESLGKLNFNIEAIQDSDDVDMHSYAIMDTLPEAQLNAEEIAKVRKNGGDEEELVGRQRKLFEEIRQEMALISGVELEEARVKRENAEYRKHFKERLQVYPKSEDRGLLVEAGFLEEQPDGQPTFTFPEKAFPPHINEKWGHYIDIVKRHVTVINRRQLGFENDPAAIAQLDSIRTHAHNNLSKAIMDYLPVDDWDLEKSRNFVIKMRDASIPNIETAEENVTANVIRRLIAEVDDLKG